MRTTIRLNDDLLRRARKRAAETDSSLTDVIEDALRLALADEQAQKMPSRVKLPTMSGNGLQPGVNLNNSAALRDLMDTPDGAV